MEDQRPGPAQPYPWYDDRVEAVRKEYVNPWAEEDEPEPEQYDTPRAIYGYLDRLVWKQDAAKKAAAVIAYNAFQRGVKSNALFIGPSGCGKTHIWRCLQKIFPGRIVIEDVSNLTNDGWKGDKKWANLLQSAIFRNGHHNILVLDEADKMLAPKFSYSQNVSQNIQSEGLTILEGACVEIKIDSVIHTVDTSRISFVLCGAFSNKARSVAERDSGSRIGFGADPKPVQPYARPPGRSRFHRVRRHAGVSWAYPENRPPGAHDGGGLLPHDGQLFQPLDPYPGAVQGKHPPHPPEAAGAGRTGLSNRAWRPRDGKSDPAVGGQRHL